MLSADLIYKGWFSGKRLSNEVKTIKENHLFDPKKIEVLEQEDRSTWLNLEEILEKVEINIPVMLFVIMRKYEKNCFAVK